MAFWFWWFSAGPSRLLPPAMLLKEPGEVGRQPQPVQGGGGVGEPEAGQVVGAGLGRVLDVVGGRAQGSQLGGGGLGDAQVVGGAEPELALDDGPAHVERELVRLGLAHLVRIERQGVFVQLRAEHARARQLVVVGVDRGVGVELVRAAQREDVDDAAQGVALGVHAAGLDLDPLHRLEGDVHRERVGHRVGHVEPVDHVAVAAEEAPLDVGVGAAADAGDQLGRPLVAAGGGQPVHGRGVDDRALGRVGPGQPASLDHLDVARPSP